MLKGRPCEFSLKAGDSQHGDLMVKYDGGRQVLTNNSKTNKQTNRQTAFIHTYHTEYITAVYHAYSLRISTVQTASVLWKLPRDPSLQHLFFLLTSAIKCVDVVIVYSLRVDGGGCCCLLLYCYTLRFFFGGCRVCFSRPTHDDYNPMRKQGGLVLGTGGDNSDRALGIFYEGAMTSGYTSAGAESAIQDNIVAIGYKL